MHNVGIQKVRVRQFALFALLFVTASACTSSQTADPGAFSPDDPGFDQAAENGSLVNEALLRSKRFTHAWLEYADPATGLIPRNLQESIDLWKIQDSAADNYPFMVLTAALADRPLFEGRMLEILRSEEEHTARLGRIPDTYSFTKQDFESDEPVVPDIIFGASEYVKDGLLPVTEWLGPSPWAERMLGILDDLWERSPVETTFGKIVSSNEEVNGEMLQVLSRVYWMTGDEKYLDFAIRLGDYYLLGDNHPTRDFTRLRLRDHGCEIVSGLTELYATVHFARPEKKDAYQEPIYAMLDRILEVGRNEHGLFYDEINPQNGAILEQRIADTFGYTYNGYYLVYQLDGIERYRQAALQALQTLNQNYRNYDWENQGVDGYADAIEGALNLYNREPIPSVADWMDSEIQVMWAMQDDHPGPRGAGWDDSAIIEGMHPDGNFARTSLMYALWKSQGLSVDAWREDLMYGATRAGGALLIHLSADSGWIGRLIFDHARHATDMKLPMDWPRINQFPEWFTADAARSYTVVDLDGGTESTYTGQELQDGIEMRLEPGVARRLIVSEGGA